MPHTMKWFKSILIFLLIIPYSGIGQDLVSLYEQVKSSVVVINVVSVTPQVSGEEVILTAEAAQGSGVLISEDGLIWTAEHVVSSAEKLQIEFLDGTIYPGTVITSNKQSDLALVKVEGNFSPKDLHIAKIADSDKVRVGEDVFVLGAPHGFKQSLSKGILSGRYTPDHLSNDFVTIELLQTDAAINPGNSGGPMFNMEGEVIGIASRIYTNSGGFEGIGFVIASNVARQLLMEEPSFWLGMESMIVDGTLAKALNVPQDAGLLITKVSSQGAASELGLQGGFLEANIEGIDLILGGDIVLTINGISITDINSLFEIRKVLRELKSGAIVSMTLLRNGAISINEFKMN